MCNVCLCDFLSFASMNEIKEARCINSFDTKTNGLNS